ncbi:MAG TPA: MarR family transcriptional regulator [Myxococcales bacterium]|nr:MarR family transcriptional regulator [Myxococcales bacterium]
MLRRQEPVGLLIAAAQRGVKLAVRRQSRALGLTSQQFWFLNAARELPGATLGEIARRQHMDAPTASRLADGLARRGLIKTVPDDRDRRALHVLLTPAGARMAGRIAPLAASVRSAVVRGMSRRQQDALRAALRQVLANVETFAAEADVGGGRAPDAGGQV